MGGFTTRFAIVTVIGSIAGLCAASPSLAALGDCSQPVSTGTEPVATDCLFILRAAVGTETCEPACICDPAGGGGVAATDALACLRAATGLPQELECNCSTTTTTTTPSSTTTTLPPTTSTTVTTSTTSSTSTSTSTTSTTVFGCDGGGTELEGSCWYLAASQNLSCDAACGALAKTCDETATRDIAGSGGSLSNCVTLATQLFGALDLSYDSDFTFCGSSDLGIGCGAFNAPGPGPGGNEAERVVAPVTTCAADGSGGTCGSISRRICACVD